MALLKNTALTTLAVLLATVPTAHASASNPGIDAGHTGYAAAGPTPPLIPGWSRRDFGVSGGASPVVDVGRVFVNTVRGNAASLVALDAATGATRWDRSDIVGEVVASGGRLFATNLPQFRLGARDASTGAPLWSDSESLFAGPVVDGGLVVSSSLLGLRAFDPATGGLLWETRDGSGSVAIDADRVYVVTGGKTDCVVRAYPRTPPLGVALQLWAAPCGSSSFGSQTIVAAAGRVYAQTVVLDAATGRLLYELPSHVGLSVAPDASAYVVAKDVITAFRPDGSERWRTIAPGHASSDTVLTPTTLYAMTIDGVLRALDIASGAVIWSATTPHTGFMGLTVTDDALVVTGDRGVLTYTTPIVRSARALAVRLARGRSALATARIDLQRPATMRMSVYRGARRMARRTVRVPAGRHTLAVRLSRAAVRSLRSTATRSLRIAILARDDSGTGQRIVKSVAVRR